jgi:hypothetical protein
VKPSLQVRKIIFHFLWAQLSEPWSLCALHTLDTEQMVCWRTDNADFYSLSSHLALDLQFTLIRYLHRQATGFSTYRLFEREQGDVDSIL